MTGGALEGYLLLDLSSCFLGSRSSIAHGLMPRRHHGNEEQPLLKEKAYKVLLKAQGAAINEQGPGSSFRSLCGA